MPEVSTVGANVVPPLTIFPSAVVHRYVAPPVVEEPFSITETVVQLSVMSAPAFASGIAPLKLTITVSLAEHPAGFVTVKMYVPPESTVGVAVFSPETIFPPMVVHANAAPEVEDEPSRTTEVIVQLSVLSLPAFTLGKGETATVAVTVFVQPFKPDTENVYVVVAVGETVIEEVVFPLGFHEYV